MTDININGPFKIEVTHELGRTWILVAIAIALIVLMYNTCRADTTKVFQAIERPNDTLEVKQSDGTIAVYVWCRVGTRMPMDTVYPYKWPDSVVRARGLDATTSGPAPRIKSSYGSAPGLYAKPHPQFGPDSAFDKGEQ